MSAHYNSADNANETRLLALQGQLGAAAIKGATITAMKEILTTLAVKRGMRPLTLGEVVSFGKFTMHHTSARSHDDYRKQVPRYVLKAYDTEETATHYADAHEYGYAEADGRVRGGVIYDEGTESQVITFLRNDLASPKVEDEQRAYYSTAFDGVPAAHADTFANILNEAVAVA